MKYLAAAASGITTALATLILLNLATATCAMGFGFPQWARYTIFAVLCVISIVIGVAFFQASLHRLTKERDGRARPDEPLNAKE